MLGLFLFCSFSGVFFPALQPFQENFLSYLSMIWWALLIGFFLGGMIDHYIPQEYFSKHMASNRSSTIFRAVGLGFLMSACSHGILAIAMELYKKGASVPAVVGFLLASPWANLFITIFLFSFFGIKALLIIIASILIAITTGLLFLVLSLRGLVESNPNTVAVADDFSVRQDIRRRWREKKWGRATLANDIKGIWRGSWSLTQMVVFWIFFGIFAASLGGTYIPEHFFHQTMGPTPAGLAVTLAAATVIEICSEGSVPIAFELYRQTGAIGNSFVFMMAGVVTDYTEIGLLWSNIGKKTALWMVALTVPQVVFLGWIFNRFF